MLKHYQKNTSLHLLFKYFVSCLCIPILISFRKLLPLPRKQINKTVGLLEKLQNVLTRISKLFVRPHIDHDDIIYDQVYNFAFHQKLEPFHACFPINTSAIRRTTREKLYQKLHLVSCQLRGWYRALLLY